MSPPASHRPPATDALERDRLEQRERADRLQESMDRLIDKAARQADELAAIRKMLRRREAQLAKSEA